MPSARLTSGRQSMSSPTSRRRARSKTDHLAKAKDYIAKGEDYYRRAAEEIVAAQTADPTLGYRAIGETLGRSPSWCQRLVTHFTSVADPEHSPFGGPEENEARYGAPHQADAH